MDKFLIRGGRSLHGWVQISGAKNAALPAMAATLLSPGVHSLDNVPDLCDITTMSNVLRVIGAKIYRQDSLLSLDTRHCDHLEAPYELVKTMRASIYVLGPLLARFGRVKVSLPGGCAWGPRPVNLHLAGLKAMGADIKVEHGYIIARAKRLRGARIAFDKVSVGATANLLMASVLARGTTLLLNAAQEPEIDFLKDLLLRMGARIERNKQGLHIQGVDNLGYAHEKIIPDRIEAGTFLAAAAITGSAIDLHCCSPAQMGSIIRVFRKAGLRISVGDDWIKVHKGHPLRAIQVTTAPYPGFPTDMQAQIMAVLCMARGTSTIVETVFADRFTHVPELRRLGAQLALHGNRVRIQGQNRLSGANVMATDLRASAALVVAGLMAKGVTEISRVYHIDRGYQGIERKLKKLGASIARLRENT